MDQIDLEQFNIDAIDRHLGGVYMGINKGVGKSHWEVFRDEEANTDVLTTSAMNEQNYGTGSFDIDWGRSVTSEFDWHESEKQNFRKWLIDIGLDPDDKLLTIGYPKIGQVDLDYLGDDVIGEMSQFLNICSIKTSTQYTEYNYRWEDDSYIDIQKRILYR